MSNAVRHARPAPAEWPGLTAYAQAAVPAHMPPDRNIGPVRMSRLINTARELPGDQLEAAYYYGLGTIMCGMVAQLQIPEVRSRVVYQAAKGMLKDAMRQRGTKIPPDQPFVPTVRDLLSDSMTTPFFGLAHVAWGKLPPPLRGLTDALSVVTIDRRNKANGLAVSKHRWLAPLLLNDEARTQRPAAHYIKANSLTGAVSILQTLLIGPDHNRELPEEAYDAPVDIGAVATARHSSIYTAAARLRLDEFRAGLGWSIRDGQPHFDASVLATPPAPVGTWPYELQPDESVPHPLREERFVCPAIHAGGLALDVARHILPASIAVARLLIPQEHFRVVT